MLRLTAALVLASLAFQAAHSCAQRTCPPEEYHGVKWPATLAPQKGKLRVRVQCPHNSTAQVSRACWAEGRWGNNVRGKCFETGCENGARTAPDILLRLALDLVAAESLNVTQPCVLAGLGPGMYSPISAARAYRAVATAMYNAWTLFNGRANPTVELPGLLETPIAEGTKDIKTYAIALAAYQTMQFLLPQAVEVRGVARSIREMFHINVTASHEGDAVYGAITEVTKLLHDQMLVDGFNQEGCYKDNTWFMPVNNVCVLGNDSMLTADAAATRSVLQWQPIMFPGRVDKPQQFTMPQAATAQPFAMPTASAFRAPVPPTADELALQFAQLTVIQSSLPDNGDLLKVISVYWLDGAGTPTPPGHWMRLAGETSRRLCQSLDESVQMLFLVANSLYDAGLAAWDTKRFYETVRPCTYIPMVLSGIVNGTSTRLKHQYRGPYCPFGDISTTSWQPYQSPKVITPPFPEYVSGHSTFSRAAADALELFTGLSTIPSNPANLKGSFGYTMPAGGIPWESLCKDGFNAYGLPCIPTACSTNPRYNSTNNYSPKKAVTLQWTSFREMADQAGESRLMGGIHIHVSDIQGRVIGAKVADAVYARVKRLINGEKEGDSPRCVQ